ncbi:hypothetical protein IAQ61_004948 [Plenodomus lingam]|nr:hypothetical protein IAQ61_004948 [Plenodomus lingam]
MQRHKTLNSQIVDHYVAVASEGSREEVRVAFAQALRVAQTTKGIVNLSTVAGRVSALTRNYVMLLDTFWTSTFWLAVHRHFDQSLAAFVAERQEIYETPTLYQKLNSITHIIDYWGDGFWHDLGRLGVRLPLNPGKNLIEQVYKAAVQSRSLATFACNIRSRFLGGSGTYFVGGLVRAKKGETLKKQVNAGTYVLARLPLAAYIDAVDTGACSEPDASEVLAWQATWEERDGEIGTDRSGDDSDPESEGGGVQAEQNDSASESEIGEQEAHVAPEAQDEQDDLTRERGEQQAQDAQDDSEIDVQGAQFNQDDSEIHDQEAQFNQDDSETDDQEAQFSQEDSEIDDQESQIGQEAQDDQDDTGVDEQDGRKNGKMSSKRRRSASPEIRRNRVRSLSLSDDHDHITHSWIEDSTLSMLGERQKPVDHRSTSTHTRAMHEMVDSLGQGPWALAMNAVREALGAGDEASLRLTSAKTQLQQSRRNCSMVRRLVQADLGLTEPGTAEMISARIRPLERRQQQLQGLCELQQRMREIRECADADTQDMDRHLPVGSSEALKADMDTVAQEVNRLRVCLGNMQKVEQAVAAAEMVVAHAEQAVNLHIKDQGEFAMLVEMVQHAEGRERFARPGRGTRQER